MNISQVTGIYFSATGQTKFATELLLSHFKHPTQTLDLTSYGRRPEYHFGENEAVIVSAPVYAGRIPATAKKRFAILHGKRTPAILLVTYGNRAYGDALCELKGVLEEQGFLPVSAAAIVARHSMIPEIAADRPDQDDAAKIKEFAARCEDLLKALPGSASIQELSLPGNFPEKEAPTAHLKIKVSNACTGCGTCIRECPEQAVSRTDPKIMDEARCTGCMRCIALCPADARSLSSQFGRRMRHMLKAACRDPKEPEFFFS